MNGILIWTGERDIKKHVHKINWIPEWGLDRELEWLTNMGDWMISKKDFGFSFTYMDI